MDRRSFIQMAVAAPVFAQVGRPGRQGWTRPAKPAPPPAAAPKPVGAAWTQWGGPHRNFQTEASGIKDVWPATGPRVMWKRPLGDGYSSTLVENGVVYTMYGKPKQEITLAANAETGQTLWEQTSAMGFNSDAPEMGNGPYSTPLIVGDRLFTTGVAGRLQCLDKKSGNVLWTQQLWEDHNGSRLMYGYASSPIAFRDTVIVPVGGPGKAVMAFRQADGKVAWSRENLGNVYSSPILIDLDGLEQLVVLLDGAMMRLQPAQRRSAVAGAVQGRLLDCRLDAALGTGQSPVRVRGIQRRRQGRRVEAQRRRRRRANELWSSNRLRLHHGNAMRVGETIYFSSGGKGSQAILSAVDARSGKIHWQERSIEKATFVWADGKLITLDQSGALMIAHPSTTGFKVAAKAPLLSEIAWTPPSSSAPASTCATADR